MKKNAIFDDGSGETFIDKDFHAYLLKSGIEQEKGKNNEWFNITGSGSKHMINDFLKQKGFYQINILDHYILNCVNENFYCSHKPLNNSKNLFNLFGHIHKLQMVKRNGLNVGTDCHNFYPIDLETVLFYKDAIKNVYDENVFMD